MSYDALAIVVSVPTRNSFATELSRMDLKATS